MPAGDVIIHAGDVSGLGRVNEIKEFLNWFSSLDYKYKVFIAGNHDFFFEKSSPKEIFSIIPQDIIYLNDSGIEIEGLQIWGSPVTPWFNNWAFNRNRGVDIRTHWEQIPGDTQVLITHGPPFRILDETVHKLHVGCKDLFNIVETIKPQYHLFGHVHEGYGLVRRNETTFINASVLDAYYSLKNNPVVFEI